MMIRENHPLFFANQTEFRNWLEKNHDKASELIVGYYKTGTGKPSMTWSESVDQALCFGWIDGLRKSIDHESYFIRFTPRKKTSIWSAINLKKIEMLTGRGLMHPAGVAIFNARDERKQKIYSFEREQVMFSEEYETLFRENQKAWSWFQAMPKSYQKPATNWVMSAKQENTRRRRLNELVKDCEAGKKIKSLNY